MADFALFLDAPNRDWAARVEALIQQALGDHGSVSMQLPGESLPNSPSTPGYVVTGIAVCDEPAEAMLALITSNLLDYEVEKRELDSDITQIVVRPHER